MRPSCLVVPLAVLALACGSNAPGGGGGDVDAGPGSGLDGGQGNADPTQDDPAPDFCSATDPLPGGGGDLDCFADPISNTISATIEHSVEELEGQAVVHIRLTLDPRFADNTYGETGSIGWDGEKNGFREFSKLVGSDHAELLVRDGDGELALQFKMDYITADPDAPSGYSTLGVDGGDGEMIFPADDSSAIVKVETSISRNLNEHGYGEYIVDSPPTSDICTASAEAPDWEYQVVFDVWILLSSFGDAGYGETYLEFVHASPAKGDENTLEVDPAPCPDPGCWGDTDYPCEPPANPPPPDGTPCESEEDCPLDDVCSVDGYCRPVVVQ